MAGTTDPFRLRVHKALTECLEGITPANGYTHDMDGRVARGRVVFGEEAELPFIAILEPPLPIEQNNYRGERGISTGEWDLMIQGFVKDDRKHPTDPAHLLMAEVKKRLALEKRDGAKEQNILGFQNKIRQLAIGPGVVRPADQVSDTAYFYLGITLTVAENLEDPYQ